MSRDDKGRFIKGKSGNPSGRPPKGEALTDVLRSKVDKEEIAQRLIDMALGNNTQGDRQALQYIFDRMDGTPRQTIDQNVRQVPDVVGYEPDDFTRSADSEDPDADTE